MEGGNMEWTLPSSCSPPVVLLDDMFIRKKTPLERIMFWRMLFKLQCFEYLLIGGICITILVVCSIKLKRVSCKCIVFFCLPCDFVSIFAQCSSNVPMSGAVSKKFPQIFSFFLSFTAVC